jgi:hypothetical protein
LCVFQTQFWEVFTKKDDKREDSRLGLDQNTQSCCLPAWNGCGDKIEKETPAYLLLLIAKNKV